MEGAEAIEEVILGQRVAWTVDDDVYVYTGDTTEREDGYVHIGTLGWEDTPDDPADDAGYNIERLREFFFNWKENELKKNAGKSKLSVNN